MDTLKRWIMMALLLLCVAGLRAQDIGYIETTNSWYYIYDQNGKKIKSVSKTQGELKGYSAKFYVLKQGSGFYVTYDVNGKRLHTFGVSTVGEILSVAGDSFTSRQGPWIYTWSKDGKKLGTRSAQ